MNSSDRESLRKALLEQRQSIVSRATHRFNSDAAVNADGVPDFADYAVEKAAIEVDDQIAESEDNLLEKIDLALQRIEQGNYDKCADCGGKIPIERLRAKPAVTLCVNCQKKKEESAA